MKKRKNPRGELELATRHLEIKPPNCGIDSVSRGTVGLHAPEALSPGASSEFVPI